MSVTRIIGWPTSTGMLPLAEPHMPLSKFQAVFAHAVDLFEDVRALADERRPAHGPVDLAALDEIALGDGKVEFPGDWD